MSLGRGQGLQLSAHPTLVQTSPRQGCDPDAEEPGVRQEVRQSDIQTEEHRGTSRGLVQGVSQFGDPLPEISCQLCHDVARRYHGSIPQTTVSGEDLTESHRKRQVSVHALNFQTEPRKPPRKPVPKAIARTKAVGRLGRVGDRLAVT